MPKSISYIPGNRAGIKEDPMKEGIIEVRPGTKGIDLGDREWCMAYIRVLDDSHYFKGKCIYSNDLPDNYDIVCYFRDPSHGLKMLKTVTPELDIGNGIMTRMPNLEWMIEEIKHQVKSVRGQISGLPDDVKEQLIKECTDILKGEEQNDSKRSSESMPGCP